MPEYLEKNQVSGEGEHKTAAEAVMSDAAKSAGAKAREVADNVNAKVDETRGPAADTLESTASALRQKADKMPGGEHVANAARTAADKLQDAAAYVRQHDVTGMLADAEGFVKKHAGTSLLAAAGTGFLLGLLLRNKR